jgi:protein SCO1/2
VGHPFHKHSRTIARMLAAMILVGLGVLAACGPSHSAKPAAEKEAGDKAATEAKDTTAKRYNLTGRVASIDKSTRSINVDGNEIPGFMAAMTMPYQVKDAGVLEKLSPGDQIKAEIVMGNEGAYLENIVIAQRAPASNPSK